MNGFDMDPFSCLVKVLFIPCWTKFLSAKHVFSYEFLYYHFWQVYDTPENNLNLNDVIEFVGIYTFDSELAEDEDVDPNYPTFELMEDITDHIPPTKVCWIYMLIICKI